MSQSIVAQTDPTPCGTEMPGLLMRAYVDGLTEKLVLYGKGRIPWPVVCWKIEYVPIPRSSAPVSVSMRA